MSLPAFAHRCLFVCLLLTVAGIVQAQHYEPVDDGSKVQFTIKNHLIVTSTVNGYFKGLKGDIRFDPNNLKSAEIEATVSVKTISTGIAKRDKDLLQEKYFDAAQYPVIKIHSHTITAKGKQGTYQLTASLTIKGITKTITFPFTATLSDKGYLFQGNFSINRKDFHVGPDNAIDDTLKVTLHVFAQKKSR